MASVSWSALMRWSGSQTCSLHPLRSLGTVEVVSLGMVSTVLSVWAWAGMDSMTVTAINPAMTLRLMWFLQNERYGTYDDQ
jgi:hypothetical protein